MDKIGEAILDKVKAEAQEIVKAAEEKALERLDEAVKQQEARFEVEKGWLMDEAEGEAARIHAQASIKARQELSAAKQQILDDIVSRVKEKLSGSSAGKSALLGLIKESVEALGVAKAVLYVSPKDTAEAKKLVKEDRELAGKIQEVREHDCLGGVIAEDIEGRNRIDNSYDARLEQLLPQIMPDINKELFKSR